MSVKVWRNPFENQEEFERVNQGRHCKRNERSLELKGPFPSVSIISHHSFCCQELTFHYILFHLVGLTITSHLRGQSLTKR
jgi:hypothetical protein